jgi:hypothetical protein
MIPPTTIIGDQYAKQIARAFIDWRNNAATLPASRLIHVAPFDPTELIRETFGASGKAQATQIIKLMRGPQVGFSFNLRSPEAETWIEKYAASEIKYIDTASKQTIRQIILQGFQEGLTPTEQAKQIKPYIGLTPRQAAALENYANNLGIDDEAQAWKMTEKYGNRLLRDRALNIALTEGHIASNEGYMESTSQAVDRGVIDPEKFEYVWILTHDERTCQRCRDHEGDTAEIPQGKFKGGEEPGRIHNRDRCCRGIQEKNA